MQLSRIAPAVRLAVRATSRRTLATAAAARSHQQSNKQQQSTGGSNGAFRWTVAGLAAIVTGGVAVAACEKVVEQPKGGGVDYDALRKDLENLIEGAEGSGRTSQREERLKRVANVNRIIRDTSE
jgi:hypothetical protein